MNLILIGFMASGKSSIAKRIANKTDLSLVDLDQLIESSTTLTIEQIFEKLGEKTFRQLENYYLKELLKQDNLVIATGGGIVINKDNRTILKEQSCVIYLQSSAYYIHQFSSRSKKRPLLNKLTDPLKEIDALLQKRIPWYEECSSFKINTAQRSLKSSVDKILEFYNKIN